MNVSALNSLPAVPDTALPAKVRAGSPEDRTAYKAALGFERMLLGQLMETATKGSSLTPEGPQGAAIQDALTDALVAGGGLGLAGQLYASMRPEAAKR